MEADHFEHDMEAIDGDAILKSAQDHDAHVSERESWEVSLLGGVVQFSTDDEDDDEGDE